MDQACVLCYIAGKSVLRHMEIMSFSFGIEECLVVFLWHCIVLPCYILAYMRLKVTRHIPEVEVEVEVEASQTQPKAVQSPCKC